jgi:Phosphotransferase system, mannose/fructose/N-acetylgalactosamine-specific component IIB
MGTVHLARIDERLIHGQVMTNLSKSAGANSIFIIDDGVAADDFMKTIFLSAGSRTGLEVKILSIKEAIQYWKDEEFGKFNAIVLTKTIDGIQKIVEGGIPIKELNIGGIAKKPDTEYIINAVAINKEQGQVLQTLHDETGMAIYFQSVPSAPRVELADALKKL